MTTPNLVVSRPISTASIFVISQSSLLWIAILTPIVFVLNGYHPFADDAAIYTASIRKLADPSLYRLDGPFVLAQAHLSLFPWLMAWMVRFTRIPLEPLLLATHLASIFLFLVACWTLAERIFILPAQRWCAVTLAGVCFTLPIAGTSLSLMDPYLTARSFSTPFGLLALTAAIDRKWKQCLLLLAVEGLMHPLMAGYTAAFILLFALVDAGLPRAAVLAALYAMVAAGVIFAATRHGHAMPAYQEAVLSRRYLIPWLWPAIDDLGLAMPLILLCFAAKRWRSNALARKLSLAASVMGIAATLTGFAFLHSTGSLFAGSMFLVRMQPLRSFHIIYAVGVILLGGVVGSTVFAPGHGFRSHWMAVALVCVAAALSFRAQYATYQLSAHLELPGVAPRNPWQQAFVWIRENTPRNAVFAANPDLIFAEGEDSQGFRVTTERSLLADNKDEGVVVSFPYLAEEWARQRNPQRGVDAMTDGQRVARLRPLGADWVLLARPAATGLACPYRNSVAQVCRLD